MTRNKEINKWDQKECMYHAHFTSRAARDILMDILKKDLSKKAFELQCNIYIYIYYFFFFDLSYA